METLHAPVVSDGSGVKAVQIHQTPFEGLEVGPTYNLVDEDKTFQKKQARLTAVIISLWTLVQIITFIKNLFIYNLLAEPVHYGSQITKRAIPWATGIAFIFIINYTSKYFLRAKVKLVHLPLIHFVLASLISIAMYLSIYYAISIMGTTAFETSSVLKYFMVEIDRLFLVYLLISITTTAHYYFYEIRRKELALQKMESAYQKSRILSLNNEVNPHMLFNVLNNIYTVVSSDIQRAKNMILDFSELLRENLRNQASIYISMTHEKAFLRNYMNLQNADRIQYELVFTDHTPQVNKALLPKMVLQPLVENAIKHTELSARKRLSIIIESKIDNGFLHIIVSNKMSPHLDQTLSSKMGIGTRNILKRLELLYPNNFDFKIRREKNTFNCLLKIPFKEEPAPNLT